MGPPGGVRQVAFLFLEKTVIVPIFRIVVDIIRDELVSRFSSDNVFPIIALPEFAHYFTRSVFDK